MIEAGEEERVRMRAREAGMEEAEMEEVGREARGRRRGKCVAREEQTKKQVNGQVLTRIQVQMHRI